MAHPAQTKAVTRMVQCTNGQPQSGRSKRYDRPQCCPHLMSGHHARLCIGCPVMSVRTGAGVCRVEGKRRKVVCKAGVAQHPETGHAVIWS